MTPAGVDTLVKSRSYLHIEKSAGLGSFFTDEGYIEAGAHILDTA